MMHFGNGDKLNAHSTAPTDLALTVFNGNSPHQ